MRTHHPHESCRPNRRRRRCHGKPRGKPRGKPQPQSASGVAAAGAAAPGPRLLHRHCCSLVAAQSASCVWAVVAAAVTDAAVSAAVATPGLRRELRGSDAGRFAGARPQDGAAWRLPTAASVHRPRWTEHSCQRLVQQRAPPLGPPRGRPAAVRTPAKRRVAVAAAERRVATALAAGCSHPGAQGAPAATEDAGHTGMRRCAVHLEVVAAVAVVP